ncbi:MAG: hypothetical protein JW910_12350, partial [Anaerolineae bacterium]|nr:hypothetical protein [Anaerolineae bacterium]
MRRSLVVVAWGILAVAVLGVLAVSASWSQAASLRQGDATPTPDGPSVPPMGGLVTAGDDANLAALAEAAAQENLEWENATFWVDGLLGDAALQDFAINFAIGEAIPAFEMPTLDGGVYELATGTPLLVNFWASWC